jgi:hypothetical protein
MPNLRMTLITVCAYHCDPGRSVSTLRQFNSAAMAVALISSRPAQCAQRGHAVTSSIVSPSIVAIISSRIGLKACARVSASALLSLLCSCGLGHYPVERSHRHHVIAGWGRVFLTDLSQRAPDTRFLRAEVCCRMASGQRKPRVVHAGVALL